MVSLGTAAVGVVTDSVSEVLRVPRDVVDAMPALMARDSEMADITQICRLDNGKRQDPSSRDATCPATRW